MGPCRLNNGTSSGRCRASLCNGPHGQNNNTSSSQGNLWRFFYARNGGEQMPSKPKRPCSYPGCPNLTDGQYCEEHRVQERRKYDKYERSPDVHKKYGRAWKRIRDRYLHLVTAIAAMAREQKRISVQDKEVDNEKYAFRCFLLRLGFIGDEFKWQRKFLLRNLSGSAAFKSGKAK